jgi:multiple sugar transport system ATP-binding protein
MVLSPGGIDVRLEMAEPTGSETYMTLSLGKHSLIAVFRDRPTASSGDTISIGFASGRTHLFDAATTARLQPLPA